MIKIKHYSVFEFLKRGHVGECRQTGLILSIRGIQASKLENYSLVILFQVPRGRRILSFPLSCRPHGWNRLLAPTGRGNVCQSACISFIMLRMALKEFLQHAKGGSGARK